MNQALRHHKAAALMSRQWRRRKWSVLLAGVLIYMLTLVPGKAGEPAEELEYKVKAGYLFNFAKFIEWPAGVLPMDDRPFIIDVLDDGEATPVLRRLFSGKNIAGHPVQVRSVSADNLPKDAHILLVTRAAGKTPEEIHEALGPAPTLLVGETEQFAERGGAIAFVHEDDNVRLTLCLEHATEVGLKVSARLSSVAKSVRSKRKG